MAAPPELVSDSWRASHDSHNDHAVHVIDSDDDGGSNAASEEHAAGGCDSDADEAQSESDRIVKEDLAAALDSIEGTGGFYAHFTLTTAANPGLEIEGLRRFGMPLSEFDIKAIVAESTRAPYGKGTETLINEEVRRTWEIDGARIKLRHPQWSTELDKMMTRACNQLGVAGGSKAVEAQLYKLLVYEEGAMFKPHKDSEKVPRMFGTLVVSLPSLHTGGDLIVTFGGRSHSLSTSLNSEWSSTCMAWYSDIVHEIKPVTSGYRVVLTYNLVAKAATIPPSLSDLADKISDLRIILTKWKTKRTPAFFVYALEHTYTEASICASQLKGTDIQRLQCLMHLQEEFSLKLCFASLQKSVLGDCDDWIGACNQWDRDRNGYDVADDFPHQITNEIETYLELAPIFDLRGKVIADSVQVDEEENLAKSYFYDERDPDDEEFEGHTGNEGATTKHWYKRMLILSDTGYGLGRRSRGELDRHGSRIYPISLRKRLSYSHSASSHEIQKLRLEPALDQAALAKICSAAMKSKMCDRIHVLSLVLDGYMIMGDCHKAGVAIQGFACTTAADTIALLRRCQTIGKDDLMAGVISGSRFNDWTQCIAVIDCCLIMKRVDLAVMVMKWAPTFKVEQSVEQADMLLNSLDVHSNKLTFDLVRDCLEAAFGWSRSLAVCCRILEALTARLSRENPAECEQIEAWMRELLKKTLSSMAKIAQPEFDSMQQIITEQGSDWFFASLVPLAFEKCEIGNLTFSTSLVNVIMTTPDLADHLGSRALSAFAPLIIGGISFNGPKPHATTALRQSWFSSGLGPSMGTQYYQAAGMMPAHQVTCLSCTCEDMLSTGEIVLFRSALISCGLTAEQICLEEKLVAECKGMQQSNEPFLHELLSELAKRTDQADPSVSEVSTWFRDLVTAFVVRIVGFEPAAPENWTPPTRRGCGCTDCVKLDMFLLNPKQKEITLNLANMPAARHIEVQIFGGLAAIGAASSEAQYTTYTSKYGYKRDLNIIKKYGDFDLAHSQWTARAALMRNALSALGSPDRLQILLGSRYEDVVELKIVSLQRLPNGFAVADTYQAPISIPVEKRSESLRSNAEDSRGDSPDLEISGCSGATTMKRKLPEDAGDKMETAKKSRSVTDLREFE